MLSGTFLNRTAAEHESHRNSVCSTLARLGKARQFIGIRFNGDRTLHHSLILEVLPDDGHLVIDELQPDDKGVHGQPGQACEVTCTERGVRLRFDTTVIESGLEDDGRFYRLALPKAIEKDERRAAFRVYVPAMSKMTATVPSPFEKPWAPRLRDVSVAGVKLEFREPHASGLRRGTVLAGCVFRITDELTIECDIEVRNVAAQTEPSPHVMIGARFVELARDRKRALERALMIEQRRIRKRS